MTTTATPPAFGQNHFAGLNLGDQRVNHRLTDLADQLLAGAADSGPSTFANPADSRAFQRLVNRPQATHESVRATHTRLTRQRMAEATGVVLVLHDTTELDYSGRSTLTQIGPIGNGGGRGWLCHNSLAVAADDGSVLGLAHQILHRRVEPAVTASEGVAAKRQRASRESRLWGQGVEAVGAPPPGQTWIHVCDRAADTFEFLQPLSDARESFVLRSGKDRSLRVSGDGPSQTLHAWARQRPAAAGWRGEARASTGPSRSVKLQAAWATVTLKAPHVRRGQHDRRDLTLQVIRVWEVEAPAGVKPVEWLLLTDQPVADAADLRRVVGYYQRRPIIEEYHKVFKSGCRVEHLQQRTTAALHAAIGITAVVAVGLLELRDLARDPKRQQMPAADVVGAAVVRVLSVWRQGREQADWSVKEFIWALGRLGGHMNRPSDGPPGWQTLWRGLHKLRVMLEFDQQSRATCGTR